MGQLIFHSYLLYTLIDSEAIHYLVASGIIEKIRLEPTLVSQVNIKMSNTDKVNNSHMLIRETISLRG